MLTIFLLAVALAMDAFAVAVSRSAVAGPQDNWGHALRVAAVFGLAQAVMPLIGWTAAASFAALIRDVDHWIAFGLLALLGGRMVWLALFESHLENRPVHLAGWALAAAAVATSVDAAAAGITLTVFPQPLLLICLTIGLVTLGMTLAGAVLGRVLGEAMGRWAELLGGLVLMGIGTKILIEHQFLS